MKITKVKKKVKNKYFNFKPMVIQQPSAKNGMNNNG